MPLAEVHVTLKPALFDAQGETIKKALHQLGHTDVQSVRIGKIITLEIAGAGGPDEGAALQGQLDLMCRQLLANPVIEDYEVSVEGADPLAIADATALPLTPVAPTAAANGTPANAPANAGAPLAALPIPAADPTESSPAGARLQPAHAEAVTTSRAANPAAGASVAPGVEAVSTPGGVTDPFHVDFRSYEAMATEAKQSLRILALRKYGSWIENQLRQHSAAWILCLGQKVIEHGDSADSAPSDQHLLKMGIEHDLVPWVFNRPS